MKTQELINALREADPSGELDVVIHEDCDVTDVDFSISPNYMPKNVQRKPRVRLITDCYCGYS